MIYLEENRDYLTEEIEQIDGLRMSKPDGTFLAWIDCSGLNLPVSPYRFFYDNAKIVFNDGRTFGEKYSSFIRLNFGTSFETLQYAVKKIKEVTEKLHS